MDSPIHIPDSPVTVTHRSEARIVTWCWMILCNLETMRAPRRILVSPSLPRRLSPPISRRIPSILASSKLHLYSKPRGSAPSSSLAVNSGLNHVENIFSNGPVNTPPNNSTDKHQSGKHLLQFVWIRSVPSVRLRYSDTSTAVPEAYRLWCAARRRPSNSNHSEITGSTR